ncbi:MAG: HAD family hydrolase, partial [Bacillales bacterium]
MKPFIPQLVYFEPEALSYPLGKELKEKFEKMNIDIRETTSHNQVRGIPGDNELQRYRNAKSTLVVGVRRTLKFDTSKPSAEYAIPLATGCMGHCHYCYLQTTLGSKPYIRVYVNLDDIFAQAEKYIDERAPQITRFEAACTSDIVGIDHLTHSLKKAIEFIGATEYGRLRFVTKYEHVDHLLDAKHNGKTRFRFSVNSRYVIKNFEPGTSSFDARLEAARKVDTVVLDKTGTVTEGRPKVNRLAWFNVDAMKYTPILYSIEKLSEHPLAEAIVRYLDYYHSPEARQKLERMKNTISDSKEEERIPPHLPNLFLEGMELESVSGKGVIGRYEGETYYVGNPTFLKENNVKL